jgi:hypothetical protein
MIFTQEQTDQLLQIVEYNSSFLIGFNLGVEALTAYDKFVLQQQGIDLSILDQEWPPYLQSFMWGRLSQQLSEKQASMVEYDDFEKYLKRGQYIPLSKREKREYEIARSKSYGHIKSFTDKIKNDVNGVIANEEQESSLDYAKLLKEELSTGVRDRKSLQNIVSELGTKTGNWGLDWGQIVDTEANNIFQRGRSEMILREKGENAEVYKDVFPGACKWCIKLYLTEGIGSQPIVFKLPELISNGSNVGRKQADWLATIDSTHPFCRCTLREKLPHQIWNEESKTFTAPEKHERKIERKSKAKITVGDKKFEV